MSRKLTLRSALSTVADGTMLDRENQTSAELLENRRQLLATIDAIPEQTAIVCLNYKPGRDYLTYREAQSGELGTGILGDHSQCSVADALVTTQAGVALFLPVADCAATILHDPEQGVLMLSHLGRHSLEVNGGAESVRHLVDHYGCDPSKLKVWVGPTPSKEAYPIFKLDGAGMKEAAVAQLLSAGVLAENIDVHPAETDRDDSFFSHSEFKAGRRDSDGRFAVAAMLV